MGQGRHGGDGDPQCCGRSCRELLAGKGGRETEESGDSRLFVPTAGRVEVPSTDKEVMGEAVWG